MSYRPLISPLSASALVVALGLFGCSDSGGNAGTGGSTSQGQGGSGTTSGGKSGSGGSSSANGGSSSGGAASGGASSGGAQAKGGASSGGSSAGGSTAGGSSAGGSTSSGGQASGGASTSGGSSSGGRAATGGGPATGGTSSGGAATGGGPAGGAASGGGGSVKVCDTATTLKAAAACNNKLIGAAISHNGWSNQQYANAANEFNYVTPENGMKWEVIEKTQGQFDYSQGDALVSWAGSSKKIKGHTLVWHSQLASWVNNLSGPDVLKAMNNHITSVMTHYKGKLHAWDVVNEAWVTKDSSGNENKKGEGTASLRDSPFKKIGEDFIDQAFKTARAADPNVLLFYNDYSTERVNDKSTAVYNMVKSMKERGIPIDGVGMQMHIGAPNDIPSAASIKENIDRLTALGLQVQISEMDTNTCDRNVPSDVAKVYHDIVAVCVANPLCTAITVWGVSDSGSWLRDFPESPCNGQTPNALLFDSSYQKKATYNSTLQALLGK